METPTAQPSAIDIHAKGPIDTMTDTVYRPSLTFLSPADRDRIHRAALEILDRIGMRIHHPEALRLLADAGCPVTDETLVRIPADRVEAAIRSAPSSIPIFDRAGAPAMDLGGYRSYFGTGSDLMYTLDPTSGERRVSGLDDVARAARVCDALPNIDFIMSSAHPSDVPPHRAYLESIRTMAESSVKPIVCTAECRDDLAEMGELARTLRGGDPALRERPYLIHYAEPISPLKHPFNSLDKLLYCAEAGIPAIYSPAPIAGSTAPMTVAGHVAQGLAESLCGLVIHQLKAQGAPFLMGMGAAVLDMATGQCSYNAPEYYLAYMGITEMSHHFDLPSWGYAGTSDSQIPDGQATLEAGMLTFIAGLAGANLNHDVGYLDFGLTGSLEMVVICDEIIDQVRRLLRGIPVDDETLGVSAVAEVGPGGHYLTHAHTLKHLRSTQWRPKLLSRAGYEKWSAGGSLSFLDRARARLAEILKSHQPLPIDEGTLRVIRERVAGFKAEE